MSKEQNYKIINREEKNKELTAEIEVSVEFVESFRAKAIKTIGGEVELKGFRKGTAPEKMIVDYVGEAKIFEEMAFQAINQVLPVIMIEQKINSLTQPQISITKIAPKNPVNFKASFILMPEIELADYKKIAKSIEKKEAVEIDEKEINDYITYLQKSRAESEALKKKTNGEKTEEKKEGEEEKIELPEFNDDFVKSLGNFKDVADFKKQLKENMSAEKERQAKEKRRIEIIEKIIAESKVELPDVLVEEELDRMVEQFKSDIRNYRMEPEDYLKEIKKTEKDLRTEWTADATKRAKMNLVLPKIAVAEKIEADKEKVEHEAHHLVEDHKVDAVRAKQYVEYVLRNEAVLKFLEELK
jgi:FKBP-type peptidyl-prolyl cis-trans isomerase (trigger factor)